MDTLVKKTLNFAYNYILYENLSDEELVEAFKNGNPDAGEYLLYRYTYISKRIIAPFYLVGAEKDDLMQEALLGLYKAIREYDPDKNCSFKSYASVCIKRHIISVVRSSTRQKHNPLNNYISFNMLLYEDKEVYLLEKITDNSLEDPEDILELKERENLISYTVNKHLSKFEKQVLSCYFSGLSYQEASEFLNRDVKSVDNALQRIKRKMKNELTYD